MSAVGYAVNGGVRLRYECSGEGEPLLLIHGLGYGRWGWGPAAELLSRRFRVARYDNRGVGESDVPPGPYSVGELAEDAVAVLDAAGFEQAHVLGTSLGGMVAQELALAHPERVRRLVLACTTPGGQRAYPLPAATIALLTEVPRLEPAVALRRMVENALTDEVVARRPALVEEIYRLRLENPPPPAGWQAQGAAGAAFDAHDRIGAIRAPTLVLHGTADNVVDERNADLLVRAIEGARLERLAGAGHLFFWEQPERVAQLAGDFLEGANGR